MIVPFSFIVTITAVLLASCPRPSSAQEDLLVFTDGEGQYQLASNDEAPQIWIDSNDFKGVQRTASDLALDFGRVVGVNGTRHLLESLPEIKNSTAPVIIAGTAGNSSLIDTLVQNGLLDISDIQGKWEAYTSALVRNPSSGVPWALVVAGNDQRGTIFGLYHISQQIGVSPWYWWADVPPKRKTGIWVRDAQAVQGSPSIKYRGFFINDEAPALSGWAEKNFVDAENPKAFNSKFYKLVFELCLRLRANYVWPAMWGKSFYVDDPSNGLLADDYGVVMGTSHHEPMARSEEEQKSEVSGAWDWGDNKEAITEFFKGGIERSKDWDTVYTMGMRGSGDASSPTLTSSQLEDIINIQQSLLVDVLNTTDIGSIPQAWVLYKEVGGYYQAGMKVPDTVTLLWTDDNAGNLLRTPLANETDRKAGAGVYYHFDYVGSPRNYKWINTIQLVKTWEQMHLAYEKGARDIWIANVGDIKPLEIPMAHFLDMAYDMSKHATPTATTDWLRRWAALEFGQTVASTTADIMNTYGRLVIRRKYELLTRQPFPYSVAYYDEAERVAKEWSDLLDLAQRTHDSLPQDTRLPFFEMVLHPVLAGKTVEELYIKAALNAWRLRQRRTSADQLANDVNELFSQDAQITNRYHAMLGGKWDPILNQVHIGYTSWDDPAANKMPQVNYHTQSNVPKSGIMGVSIQGSNQSSPGDPEPTLLSMDPWMPRSESRYLDIFTRKNGTFSYQIQSNASYVSVSNATGTLYSSGVSDVRSFISVDWSAAPAGLSWVGLTVRPLDVEEGWAITAKLPVNKASLPKGSKGHIESRGVVSIEAEHYSHAEKKNGLSYATIPSYGRTLSGVKIWPVTADSQKPNSSAPKMVYPFHSFTSRSSAKVIIMLGASLNHDPSRPLKYAIAIDGGSPVTVTPVPDIPFGATPNSWTEAVVSGGWIGTTIIDIPNGQHELSLWCLEPGVVVQKVVIDLGGYVPTSLGPPESRRIC